MRAHAETLWIIFQTVIGHFLFDCIMEIGVVVLELGCFRVEGSNLKIIDRLEPQICWKPAYLGVTNILLLPSLASFITC